MVIKLTNVSKVIKKAKVLDNVNLELTSGKVYGLKGKNVFQNFPDYNFKCGASAAFRADNNLLIKVQIIDSSVGNMYISLSYIDDYVTVMMRKLEESYFNEYDGVFSGKLSI